MSAQTPADATSDSSVTLSAAPRAAPEPAEDGSQSRPATPEKDVTMQETAEEYLERKSREASGNAEIEPGAVTAVAACATCHGPSGEGNTALGAPRIGGMAEWYLARQLKHFKQGIRAATDADVYGTQMRAMTLMLESNAVIEDLAAHFSELNPPPADASVSGDAQRGEELYAVCAACHAADGSGSPEFNSPSLIGQDGAYLVRQLEHFQQGLRGSHRDDIFGQQMQPIVASTLEDEQDIADVVAYIVTLEGASKTNETTASSASSASGAQDPTADRTRQTDG